MFWQDDGDGDIRQFVVPRNVLDLRFTISCRTLPVDHAWALYSAIQEILPWFATTDRAALHLIHVVVAANGWQRTEDEHGLLYLSQRARLTLRLPQERIAAATALTGQTLNVDGNPIKIGEGTIRPLSVSTTLYARHVVDPSPGQSEEHFINTQANQLQAAGLQFKKLLCGKSVFLNTPEGSLLTRSLLIAEMSVADAVALQERGVGKGLHQKMGCGLFIPYKGV